MGKKVTECIVLQSWNFLQPLSFTVLYFLSFSFVMSLSETMEVTLDLWVVLDALSSTVVSGSHFWNSDQVWMGSCDLPVKMCPCSCLKERTLRWWGDPFVSPATSSSPLNSFKSWASVSNTKAVLAANIIWVSALCLAREHALHDHCLPSQPLEHPEWWLSTDK